MSSSAAVADLTLPAAIYASNIQAAPWKMLLHAYRKSHMEGVIEHVQLPFFNASEINSLTDNRKFADV